MQALKAKQLQLAQHKSLSPSNETHVMHVTHAKSESDDQRNALLE